MTHTPEQIELARQWRYWTKGIEPTHQRNWYNSLLREKGIEEAELFSKYVNYSNK
jgi:hypothetical protein